MSFSFNHSKQFKFAEGLSLVDSGPFLFGTVSKEVLFKDYP